MKRTVIILALLLVVTISLADWVNLSDTEELFNCEQSGRSLINIEFNLDGFEINQKEYQGRLYDLISHEDSGILLESGMPDIPVFTEAVVIPDEGTASIEVLSYDVLEFKDILIYPQEILQYEHEEQRDNFYINEQFYNSSEMFPPEIVITGEPAVMRDLRLLPVTFCPFQYDAGNHILRVYSNINISISVSGSGGVNARYSQRKRSRAFEEFYRSNTLNYEQLELRDEYQKPTILFICNDNDDVLDNLEYLTNWKKEKGFNVEVATTSETGTSNISIKNYIQDAYDNWENPPEYVNIMGDGSGLYSIPTWYTTGGYYGEGDHPYAQLEGDDVLGDVIMGRMTFSNISVLQNVINKVLTYEKTPYVGNTDWYNHALIVGDPTHSGYSCVAFGKGVKELMLDFPGNFWNDSNFTELYQGSFPTNMNNAVNDGVSFFAYRGFGGTSGWYSGSTNNGYMMPFLVMPTCNANDWASGTGNVEGFYLMGSTSMPNGGIGAMGTATGGTHTPFNNALAIGVWGGIFRDNIYSMGGAVLRGKYYLWLTFPQNPGNYVDQFSHWNTLMGDGSLELWTRVPQDLTVTFSNQIPTGSNYYQVSVLDSIGNAAEGAWVTLKSEDSEFVVSEYCDYSGSAILDVSDADEGEYILTVSKHDHRPVQEEIEISQAEYFVDISNVELNDISGNNNGNINPGETVEVIPELQNSGTSLLSGINAEIYSNDPRINILNFSAEYGNIASGANALPDNGFTIEFAGDLLGGTEIPLYLNISDDSGNSWQSLIFAEIEGASLSCISYTIDGDGILDPGETDEIYFSLHNAGQISAMNVSALLSCNNRRITISDSTGSFGNIAPNENGNNATNRFTITASMAILPGTYIPMILHITDSNGYDDIQVINVGIGNPQESDPYGPDEYGYWCYDDGDTDYAKCPDYDWIEIDPSLGGSGETFSWENDTHSGTSGDTGTYANIDLPEEFNLIFYGEEYDELCISTNGWIAPGHHESGNFMNYQIPGPQGPSPMIAVFWDDLDCTAGDVLKYYDEDLHYYVVEWSDINNGDTGSAETFQVILYDPIYYPTTTGDCEIKMQYQEINNNNSGSYPSNHGQYCTIGIENDNSLIGLQYTFNDTYPAACKELEDQMAILFTPPPIPPDGPFLGINEFSALAGDDEYIEAGETALISMQLENMGAESAHNVEIELVCNDPFITVTDNSAAVNEITANEFAEFIDEFSIDIAENVPDFYTFYLEAVINCDENSWNWMLPFTAYWANTFAVDQDSIYFELHPLETGSQTFTLENTSSIPVNFYIRTDELINPERDVTGSYVTMDTDSFTPGEETTWTFNVLNGSVDSEWISDVWLQFPLGVNVLSATNAVGGSGGNMIWDGTTGSGQTVNWHGLTANDWGVIHNGESAEWEVDVQLSTEFAGDMTIDWEIGGDGYGGEPHNVTGQIDLLYPLRWINLDTSSGTLGAFDSREITVNFDSGDIGEGSHLARIIISSDSWDSKTINVCLNVDATDDDNNLAPESIKLYGNHPNPFNPATEISFFLPTETNIELNIYNLKGQLIRKLAENSFSAGNHTLSWNGRNDSGNVVSSGIYFYQLKTESYIENMKMLMIK